MPSMIAGRYEVLGLLGVGGMGRVYRALDRKLDEHVALKMLRREALAMPKMLERFLQEVKLARRVTSPHVVRTFDVGEHEGDHFLTMEYIDGKSLSKLLEEGLLALEEALRIARGVCAGVAAAHAAGVLHRDLKPDNILVETSGRIAISDFGVARAFADSDRSGVSGTPAYMAPEQVEATGTVGAPADVYSFGAILFEMLTGERPFSGADPTAMAIARLSQPPPDPRTHRPMPAPLAQLVLRCMARDPLARFANAGAVAPALAAITIRAQARTPTRPIVNVPAKRARSVAVLPLRANAELAEIADGLSEEIVDALTQTRDLRVRPMASVRRFTSAELDLHEIGAALDVDVIVDGSVRQRGDKIRVSARATGVTDGFQLWANHVDTERQGLLVASDEIARAVAHALTADIELPTRAAPNVGAVELYLESKAKLRATWFSHINAVIPDLERGLVLAPDDPGILSSLAMALGRTAFLGMAGGDLARARTLAERAVALAPASGEAWLALGLACRYAASAADAARALKSAVARAPGTAMAQAMLGSLLLEAGELELALSHLEAAAGLDPFVSHFDLPRAYVYLGRYDDAFALIEKVRALDVDRQVTDYLDFQVGRFRMWRGELTDVELITPAGSPEFVKHLQRVGRIFRTGVLAPTDLEEFTTFLLASNARLRATNSQFIAELMLATGERAAALDFIATGVDAGLQDHLWFVRCPLLEPLREDARFRELAQIVQDRAAEVLREINQPA